MSLSSEYDHVHADKAMIVLSHVKDSQLKLLNVTTNCSAMNAIHNWKKVTTLFLVEISSNYLAIASKF